MAISANATGRGRGRPRDLEKRQAILEVAARLFVERGIAATTMELVAAEASVSKMTVYAHFPDKPALLKAAFERNLGALRLPELVGKPDLEASREALIAFGATLVAFLTRPEIVRGGGLMAAASNEHPDLAATFYAAGPAAMLAKVAGFLSSLNERKLIAVDDPELAAEQLIAAWLGQSQLRIGLGLACPPSAEAIERRVRFATETMLFAWSARAHRGDADRGR
jgi:TetR/AcrR family transcriptional repressor of mexJK operon